MEAQVGDRLIVHGRKVGEATHEGEVVEVLSGVASRYRVRWSDGHESVLCPGSDVTVERTGEPSRRSRAVTVDLRLEEDRNRCEAVASLSTPAGTFTGTGLATRNPTDPVVPLIGEELAIARSLHALAERLEEAAGTAIDAREDREIHLVP
jgi:hypothetical protein